MIVKKYQGNLFLLPEGMGEAAVVTTNGILKSNGHLVMGKGIARYCRDEYDGIAELLGRHVRDNGNVPAWAGYRYDRNRAAAGKADPNVNILSCPTKRHWRDKSDIGLIVRACRELVRLADEHGFDRVYLPALGCANGQLSWKADVFPAISSVLDDRFTAAVDPVHLR